MIWVEILSRHRDVAARFRIAGDEAYIGRGYDNDVIVDDPYVAARHLRVFRDEADRLVAEDAGSKSGIFDHDNLRSVRIIIDPERPIRIGHTHVRIRDTTYAVPLERLAGARTQSWPAITAAGLGAALLAIEVLFVWMTQTGEPRASTYLTTLLLIAGAALAWVSVWTILSRVFSGQARFAQNLLIALSGFLLISLYREFAQFAAFAFTWLAAVNYEYAVQWCIVAVACFFHLRETGRSHLVLKGAVVATVLVLAIAVQTILRSEALSDFGGQSAVRQLMPPALRLAPVRDESDFFAEIERLKAGLDRDRSQARMDAGR
jgi:pSer/pThr/pTyr-binding forkhead associated (FHA) protein